MNYLDEKEPNPIRGQSSLGNEYKRRYKEGQNIDRISLAQVINIHHRYNTVDVALFPKGDITSEGYYSEGEFSAKLPVAFGGLTSGGNAFGQSIPIEVGTLVLIGFVEGSKSNPIVISIYSKPEEGYELSRAPFAEADPNIEDLKQYTDHCFTVYPSLTYEDIDGKGNRTVSFTGQTFFVSDADSNPNMSGVTDDGNGTGYADLKSSYYYSGKLIEPKEGKAPTILFKHQGDKFADNADGLIDDPHLLMMYIGQDGTYRTSMVNRDDDWRSHIEILPDGRISLKHQKDTKGLNGSTNYNEIFLDDEGIGFIVGDKYTKITANGTTGTLGLGGGGIGMTTELEDVINGIKKGIESTEEGFRIFVEKTKLFNGVYEQDKAEWLIESDLIRSTVSEITLTGYVNGGLQSLSDELNVIIQESKILKESITIMSEDSLITQQEKQELAVQWETIQAEYPSYVNQAISADVSYLNYKNVYDALALYIVDILADMNVATNINRLDFRNKFYNYYNEKNNLLYEIFNSINASTQQVVQDAIDAGKDLGSALGSAGQAITGAQKVTEQLQAMTEDNSISISEKIDLKQAYDAIIAEYSGNLAQATEYEVDASAYTSAYDNLVTVVSVQYDLFADMNTATPVDGGLLTNAFVGYYNARNALSNEVVKVTRQNLLAYKKDIEAYSTYIEQTSREIELAAEAVVMQGKEIELANAYISIMPNRIASSTSKTYMSRELESNSLSTNAIGSNLYVMETATNGALDVATGAVVAQVDGDKVSNFMPIADLTVHTATVFGNDGANTLTICYYDGSKQFISGKDVASSEATFKLQYLAPQGAKNARISTRRTASLKLQFEKGYGSSYYLMSVQDIANDVVYATEEMGRRKDRLDTLEAMLNTGNNDNPLFVTTVSGITADLSITAQEKLTLKAEYDKLVIRHTELSAEALLQTVPTVLYESSYTTLMSLLDTYLTDMGTSSTLTTEETLPNLFQDHYRAEQSLLGVLVYNTKTAYDDSVKYLDDVTKNAVEAERVAQELTLRAEQVANSVLSVKNMIAEEGEAEQEQMDKVQNIVYDGTLTPTEIASLSGYIDDIKDTYTILIAQARVHSLDTALFTTAYNNLINLYEGYTTPDNLLKDHTLTGTTFKDAWQNYHTQKNVLMGSILTEAEEAFEAIDLRATLIRQEALRRKEGMLNLGDINLGTVNLFSKSMLEDSDLFRVHGDVNIIQLLVTPLTEYICSTSAIDPENIFVGLPTLIPTGANQVLIDAPVKVTSDANGIIEIGIHTYYLEALLSGKHWVQVERGDKVTDYKPSESDRNNYLQSKLDGQYSDIITTVTTSREEGNGQILDQVGKLITDTEGRLIDNMNASTKLTTESFDISFTEMSKGIGANADELTTYRNYFTFSEDGSFSIGNSASSYVVKITNEKMSFMDGNTEVAFISNSNMQIARAILLMNLVIGDHKLSKYANGVTTLSYIGQY